MLFEYDFVLRFKGDESKLEDIYNALSVDTLVGLGVEGQLALAFNLEEEDNKWKEVLTKVFTELFTVFHVDEFLDWEVEDDSSYAEAVVELNLKHHWSILKDLGFM